MPTDQFNLRIRAELAEAVRNRAHDERCKPRDVIEALIEAAPWSAIAGTPAPEIAGQGSLPVDVAEQDGEDVETRGCPSCADPMTFHEDADVWVCDGCGHGEPG